MATWNPWQEMDALRRQINRAFEEVGVRTGPAFSSAFLPGRAARAYPRLNMHEDREAVFVEALAPGIDPHTLELSVKDNTLTIKGEKPRLPADIQPDAFHRSERSAGTFVRTIPLPAEVDPDKVAAEYRQGLLTVTLPKGEKAKPRQVAVQVA
jgi:HSP20 family protein